MSLKEQLLCQTRHRREFLRITSGLVIPFHLVILVAVS